jgi:hypothetical protein
MNASTPKRSAARLAVRVLCETLVVGVAICAACPMFQWAPPAGQTLAADGRPADAPRAAGAAAAADNGPDEPTREEMFKQVATILKQQGTTKDDVFTITIPRDDLLVTVEGQDVPAAAGIESQFRFYQCPCGGKLIVVGSFVTADYEANDVVDALREGHLTVSSVGPFLVYENPRLTLVRFQGEAKAEEMGNILKKALEWVGDQRGKPRRPKE